MSTSVAFVVIEIPKVTGLYSIGVKLLRDSFRAPNKQGTLLDREVITVDWCETDFFPAGTNFEVSQSVPCPVTREELLALALQQTEILWEDV